MIVLWCRFNSIWILIAFVLSKEWGGKNNRCETSVKGIFAGGDVSSIPHKQIIVSMGHGATAALSASEYLIKQNVDNGVAKNTEKVTKQGFEPPASSL